MLDTLRRLRAHGTWTEIVVLLIPGLNDGVAEIRALSRFVHDELGPEVPLHFTRFHPSYRLANLPATPVPTLERARATALGVGLLRVGEPMRGPSPSSWLRPGLVAAGIGALTGLTVVLSTLRADHYDDAFISYVFARHLALGNGITWVAGDAPLYGSTSLTVALACPA